MESLFTNITNAGATAVQNENIMHTGCYAGERENLFMTETTMAPVKIALDHGWSSIKGEHIFMETSVVQVDYTPLTNHGLLEYKGQKYIVSDCCCRKPLPQIRFPRDVLKISVRKNSIMSMIIMSQL